MGTRVLFQDLYTKDCPLYPDGGYATVDEGMMKVARKVARPDTTIVHRWVPKSTFYTDMFWPEMLNNTQIVHEIIKAEKEGSFDAAIIGCGNDPGLEAAREAVDMPVVGVLETGMLTACMLGAKFACILTDYRCVPLIERKIKLYGMEDRAISRKPARACDCHPENVPQWFTGTGNGYEILVSAFDETAKECVEDGAEVVVTACAYLSALTLHGHLKVKGTECPICEGFGLGIKMAEYLSDIRKVLGVSTSRVLTYQSSTVWCTKEMIEAATEPFFPK